MSMRIPTAALLGPFLLLSLLVGAAPAGAEVTMSSPQAFDISIEATVKKDSHSVWTALIEDTGMWWHPEGTLSGDPQNVTLEAWAGGCICESLDDGGSVKQLEVVLVSQDAGILQAVGTLGPLRSLPVAGIFTLKVEELDAGGTKIILTYKVSGGAQVEPHAKPVDGLLGKQLARLAEYVDSMP